MGNISQIKEAEVLSKEQSGKLRLVFRILALISYLPCFISIFVFAFQESQLKLNQQIQLRLCILLVLYEGSYFLPISLESKWLCLIQCIFSFGIQIVIPYMAMIHSYIALIIFINPNKITTKFNKFFIYFSPSLLYIGIIVYILTVPQLKILFGFTVNAIDQTSRLINYILVFVFLLLIILNNILLIQNIKKFINKLPNIDNFAKEKLHISKKKLITNVIGIIAIFHYLPMCFLLSFKKENPPSSFGLFIYLYSNKAILGLVFWLFYIFNINLWHKLLILLRIEKKEQYEENFKKEQKLIEYSIDESKINETVNINMEELENMHTINNSKNNPKSITEDEGL